MPTATNTIVLLIAVCSLLMALLVGFVLLLFTHFRQRQRAIHSQMDAMRSGFEKELLKSRVEIQEQTLSSISRELHDDAGQQLTLARLLLNQLPAPHLEALQKAQELIGQVNQTLRNLSHSLQADGIARQGLVACLKAEVENLEQTGFMVGMAVTGQDRYLPDQQEVMLYRMAQECLQNIIKHARARQIHILLQYEARFLDMQISDDGCGFSATATGGLGMGNLHKRAALMQGQCAVHSRPGGGTTVSIRVPLEAGLQWMR